QNYLGFRLLNLRCRFFCHQLWFWIFDCSISLRGTEIIPSPQNKYEEYQQQNQPSATPFLSNFCTPLLRLCFRRCRSSFLRALLLCSCACTFCRFDFSVRSADRTNLSFGQPKIRCRIRFSKFVVFSIS